VLRKNGAISWVNADKSDRDSVKDVFGVDIDCARLQREAKSGPYSEAVSAQLKAKGEELSAFNKRLIQADRKDDTTFDPRPEQNQLQFGKVLTEEGNAIWLTKRTREIVSTEVEKPLTAIHDSFQNAANTNSFNYSQGGTIPAPDGGQVTGTAGPSMAASNPAAGPPNTTGASAAINYVSPAPPASGPAAPAPVIAPPPSESSSLFPSFAGGLFSAFPSLAPNSPAPSATPAAVDRQPASSPAAVAVSPSALQITSGPRGISGQNSSITAAAANDGGVNSGTTAKVENVSAVAAALKAEKAALGSMAKGAAQAANEETPTVPAKSPSEQASLASGFVEESKDSTVPTVEGKLPPRNALEVVEAQTEAGALGAEADGGEASPGRNSPEQSGSSLRDRLMSMLGRGEATKKETAAGKAPDSLAPDAIEAGSVPSDPLAAATAPKRAGFGMSEVETEAAVRALMEDAQSLHLSGGLLAQNSPGLFSRVHAAYQRIAKARKKSAQITEPNAGVFASAP
jgi:hypothetical protein